MYYYVIEQRSRLGFSTLDSETNRQGPIISRTAPPAQELIVRLTAPDAGLTLARDIYMAVNPASINWGAPPVLPEASVDRLFFADLLLACSMAGITISTATVSMRPSAIFPPGGTVAINGTGASAQIVGTAPGTVYVEIRDRVNSSLFVTVLYTVLPIPDGGVVPPYPAMAPLEVGVQIAAADLPGIADAAKVAGFDLSTATFESTDSAMLTIDGNGVVNPRRPGSVGVRIRSRDGSRTVNVTVEILPESSAATDPTPETPPVTPPATAPEPPVTPPVTAPEPPPATPEPPATTPPETPPVTAPEPPPPPDPVISEIRLRSTAGVGVNRRMTLEPFIAPFDADRSKLKWSSSNETIATVSNGVVTGVRAGTVNITVTDESGMISAVSRVTVRVDTRPTTGITINNRNLSLAVGAASTLTVTYRPSNATIRGVTWTSSNEEVARVEPNGRVVGIAPGTAVITAISDSGERTATANVTVRIPVASVTLPETRVTLRVGETYQIVPVITPTDATSTAVTYASRTASVATVSATGLVTARRAGSTTITVTVDGRSTTLTVTVAR
jgi:hypothetical protein